LNSVAIAGLTLVVDPWDFGCEITPLRQTAGQHRADG
jgi:hypothetical protein